MSAADEAAALLRAARRDLSAVGAMAGGEGFADEIFGFHAQQAAEKMLKAWLAFRDLAYPRSHDLAVLVALLGTNGVEPPGASWLVELNPFAVQYRYEAFDEPDDPLDRAAVVERLEKLLAWVQTQLAAG